MTNYEDLEDRIISIEEDLHGGASKIGELIGRNIVAMQRKAGYLTVLAYLPGLVLAMILSWSANQSIMWTIVHGYLSWLYVIYEGFF